MLPSLLPSLQRAAVASRHMTCNSSTAPIIRHLSSSSTRSKLPIPPPKIKPATPERIAAAKARIIDPDNPRTRQYNRPDGQNNPTYIGLPVSPESNGGRERTTAPDGRILFPSKHRYDTGVSPADMPFLHHQGHDDKPKPKYKSPRKRASALYHEITTEMIEKSKASKPEVWDVPFRVGDAVEMEVLDDGGVNNPNGKLDKIRGVVLGRHNRGLDTGIYLKDVVYGEHVERKVKLHSPMVKSLKVLEEGFIQKGKRKGRRIKRAKLYYLRDRKPEETRVSAQNVPLQRE